MLLPPSGFTASTNAPSAGQETAHRSGASQRFALSFVTSFAYVALAVGLAPVCMRPQKTVRASVHIQNRGGGHNIMNTNVI